MLTQTTKSRPKLKKQLLDIGCLPIQNLDEKLKPITLKNKKLINLVKNLENSDKSSTGSIKAPPGLLNKNQLIIKRNNNSNSASSSRVPTVQVQPSSVIDSFISQFGSISVRDQVLLYIYHTEGVKARVISMAPDGLCLYHCLYHFIEKLNLRIPNQPAPNSGRSLKGIVLRYIYLHLLVLNIYLC